MNGLKIAWGTNTANNNNALYITLPITFSNSDYIAVGTVHRDNAGGEGCTIRARATNQLQLVCSANNRTVSWIAIGY